MHKQAPPFTYHPNIADLLELLVRAFSSPGGGLLWDLLLQALTIFITVVILQRYLDRREEQRWRPARQNLYFQLFVLTDWLIRLLPERYLEGSTDATYGFGYATYISKRLDADFIKTLVSTNVLHLEELVVDCAGNPEILDSFKQDLDSTLEHSAAVFLAKDPELNGHIGRVREWIPMAEGSLEVYREVQKSGTDPARRLGSSAEKQAGIALQQLIIEGYHLHTWLAEHAVIGEVSGGQNGHG